MLVPYQNMLDKALRNCGFDPLRVSEAIVDNFTSWIQDRVNRAWTGSLWPETIELEQRLYTATWSASPGTYNSGDQVWYAPNTAYYQANASTAGTDVPGTSTKWDAVSPAKWIPFAQAGQNVIGQPLRAWRDDPRLVRGPRKLGFTHDGRTIFLDPCAPSQPYIEYRRPAPVYSGVLWDNTIAYQAGDSFLYVPDATRRGNDCYVVLAATTAGDTPVSAAAKFAVQQTPAIFVEYATRAVKADWLSDDGQDDKATQQEQLAAMWLQDRLADLTILQGQTANYAGAN